MICKQTMKETIDLLGKIITNILTALYEPFGFSLLLSFLAMFFYLYAYEPIHAGKGWKSAIVTWYQKFKESVFFRKLFFLAFVTSLILFRTLLNRQLWMNPLSDVMGGWGIWETVNGEQKLTTECIENVIMMVPFSAVVMWTFEEKMEKRLEEDTVVKRKDSVYLFDKHRDAAIIASLGYIPAIRHLLQHSRRSARRIDVLCGDEGKKASVKLDEIVIYWER